MNGNVANEFNNAKEAGKGTTEGITFKINYTITWETIDKKYESTIKAYGGGNPPKFGAEVTTIEDNKQGEENTNENGGTLEIAKGDIGPYTTVEGVQSKIQENLINQGCPLENINNGYSDKKTTNVDRGVSIEYDVTWQSDEKEYVAYVKIWGGGTTFYGSMSVNSRKRYNSR